MEKAPDDERPARKHPSEAPLAWERSGCGHWTNMLREIVEDPALRLLLLHHQGFDDVVDLEVIEVLHAHATLVALEDFLGVFLEALQRGDAGVGIHDDGVCLLYTSPS